MASPVTGWHCHRASGATALIVPGAGAEQTRPGRRELRGPGAGDSGMPARRGAHRGKPCPPSVSPPGERVRDPKGSSRRGTPGPSLTPFPSPQDPAGSCRACPPGTFSLGAASCAAHTQCRAGNRVLVAAGTAASDSRCGACLPG